MKLFLIKCYNDADFPSTSTSFSVLVLADSLEAAIEMVRPNVGVVFRDESSELDLKAIERMRKPRIIS